MQQPDFNRFKAVMTGMAKLYERDLDTVLLDAYWLALRAWSLPDFEAAAGQLMATAKFMPRPADFNELRKSARMTAGEAFAKALKHASSSAYRDGLLGDPLIDAAARALGGYQILAMSTDEGLPFLERRFAEHFETIQDAEDVRDALPQLMAPTRSTLSGPQSVAALLGQDS